jgi:hypothetical protein
MSENNSEDIKKFMDKVKGMEKNEKLDLSSGEDLSIGVMNLISMEEHLFFSGAKTGKPEYYNLLKEIREMRKTLMKGLVKDYEGEVWCMSKHLLAASMRMMEVGTKYQGKGDDKGAEEMFSKAYKLYSLFWGINLGLVDIKDTKLTEEETKEVKFIDDKKPEKVEGTSLLDKLGKLVQKAVDCCKE